MSRHIQVVQNSIEWLEARLGIPTSSRFSEIVTPKIWTFSESRSCRKYMAQLVAEWKTRQPIQLDPIIWAVERGHDMEGESVSYYELTRGVKTEECGFFLSTCERYGASPDRTVGENGLLEVKNLNADNHLLCLFENEIPDKYFTQIHGQLLVTGRDWVDFLSYSPGLPPYLHRIYPEPKYQKPLEEGILKFCDRLDEMKQKLLAMYD